MTDMELDSLMRRVLTDVIALDAEGTFEAGIAFRPSRRHHEQMQRMLKNPLGWAKNRNRTPLQNVGRWAAVILLFVSLSFGLVMLFSAPARAAVERWIVEWYETHIVYRYSGSAESLPRYELTGLPKGFTELERMEEPTFTDVVYGNESGELISFIYEVMAQGGATVFVPNEDAVFEVMIGKNQGRLFIPQDPASMKKLTWIDDKAGVQFIISADLDETDMIRLAESLRRKKNK
jgi:hypothetical protein